MARALLSFLRASPDPRLSAAVALALPETSPVLGSPIRQAILRLVQERPGISLSDLGRRLALRWGAASFHVARLEAGGLVRTVRIGRRRLVYALDASIAAYPEEHAALHEPACRRLALAIIEHPGSSVSRLVEHTGLSPRVVYHHAKRLLDLGLIASSSPGAYRGLRASGKLFALLFEGR